MQEPRVAYTESHIEYIKKVLAENDGTIKFLRLNLGLNDIEVPPVNSEEEIATCLRILETEAQYV